MKHSVYLGPSKLPTKDRTLEEMKSAVEEVMRKNSLRYMMEQGHMRRQAREISSYLPISEERVYSFLQRASESKILRRLGYLSIPQPFERR